MSLYKLLDLSEPQFLHLEMELPGGVHAVGSEEMAAVLRMLQADGGSSRGPHGVTPLRIEHHPLLTSTGFITSILLWLRLTHAF